MDIGANIGGCLLQMLARPDVNAALGFEPSASNLFYLTSSLMLNPDIKHKVPHASSWLICIMQQRRCKADKVYLASVRS
eukprot:6206097-Amphidinium_carterae.1